MLIEKVSRSDYMKTWGDRNQLINKLGNGHFLDKKKCAKCKEMLPFDKFSPAPRTKYGVHCYCKPCASIKQRAWQKAHYTAEYVARKTGYARKWRRSYPRSALRSALTRALKRKLTRNPITIEALMMMFDNQGGRCALSGIAMTWSAEKHIATSLSLDRIDNGKGYEVGNVRLICSALNAFKGQQTDNEMIAMAEALLQNFRHPHIEESTS